MSTRTSFLVVIIVALTATSLQAQNFRRLGTRRGAIAGAVIGGIIGGQNNEAAAGIFAGALVGGVAGRVYGNRVDYRQQQAYAYRRAAAPRVYHSPNVHSSRVYYPSHSNHYYSGARTVYPQQRYYYGN